MKTRLLAIALLITGAVGAQIPSYYNDVDLTKTGQLLKSELASKISTNVSTPSYTPGVWNALKLIDLDPINSDNVVLVYGYNDNDGVLKTDRSRNKNSNGGASTDWNREHVYPRSLGNPNLGSSGPGSDVHHLRPADPSFNGDRGSRRFADGSGNANITTQGNWYPGDEWKGDVARMIMYMYVRYGSRCLASNVGIGNGVSGDSGMIDLFLQWNVDDPVSAFELQRNPIIENIQGNRNPFIDNPILATVIWGGPQAEDRFGNSTGGSNNGDTLCTSTVSTFPYAESFENNLGNWNNSSRDDFNWERRSGSTPSSNTGPSRASAGSDYIYMESSAPNNNGDRAILYGPCLDLSDTATFSFKYHMYGASNMGSLQVEASTNGSSWTSIWSKSGNQGDSWRTTSIDLGAYSGRNVQLRLNGVTGTTWQGDMAVDDIKVTTGSMPPLSSNFDIRITLTFDQYPVETSWQLKNSSNQVVASGGNYGSQVQGSTLNINRTVPAGCYSFVINDSFGDGMCCQYGNGAYRLTRLDSGNMVTSGGNFNATQTRNFCLGTNSRNASEEEIFIAKPQLHPEISELRVYPNPTQDILFIENIGDQEIEIVVFNTLGQKLINKQVSKSVDLSSLPNGVYIIQLSNKVSKVTKKVVKN